MEPPVPLSGGRLTISAGSTMLFSPYLLHRRSDVHEDPPRFDPDRWDSASRPSPSRHAFLPFGSGPRKCIGEQFAIIEAVLVLATLTSRWKLSALPGTRVRPHAGGAISPGGLRLLATARTSPGRRENRGSADESSP
ncbi:cytochrome P450 [Streptomyces sp. H10-C2]|uniref:cytochrome P450 n=1 Tax=unclassified Streptomyces TaxID=2593676 RepID=UPI0024BAA6C3|nr:MULTISPECIES: cytochrome P450 [unclassified Streptomyces]MDJ0345373.1 cytochrome P450 [Streptomyces sp. PH10-H1]MDJ0372128.1 cytochrome P450 [Streptomyces sp. H10-C2]